MIKDYRKFKLKKVLKTPYGELQPNTTLTIMGNTIFVNDGIIEPQYYGYFHMFLDHEMNNPKSIYLVEIPIPNNKV